MFLVMVNFHEQKQIANYSKLQTQWRKLEKKVGCRVEEDEVWDWYKEGDINEMYS